MSKMRIYELAKELGVENKVVIAKAAELGMPGKLSHSNTLDSDEADQIRRAVLRQAVTPSAAAAGSGSKVLTALATDGTSVERLRTGIIRRRKDTKGPDEAPQSAPAEVRQETLEALPSAEVLAPTVEEREPAPAEVLSAEVIESAPSASESVVAPDPIVVPEVVASPVVVPSQTVPGIVQPVRPAASAVGGAALNVQNKALGPRVLGKIELPVAPQRKPVRTVEVKRAGAAFPSNRDAPAAPPAAGDAWKKGKKGKRREFTRTELVDYEGKEIRSRHKGRGRGDDLDRDESSSQHVEQKPVKRMVRLGEAITVGELAKQMSLKASEVIAKLMELGMMATINHSLDNDTATIVAQEFGAEIVQGGFDEQQILVEPEAEDPAKLLPRPPVVTVMGHVDHGKTTLLDSIRNASVASGEHGGITQHIGAYVVELESGKRITFIDTPGHAAFTQMRSRGARVTDIVILVVAADDGVMPQTLEALNHAQAAKVPIMVAVNKVDKPGASPDRIKQQLAEKGLQPEDWGGDTMYFHVSALKKTGIKELLEGCLLVAEVAELKANPDRRARGTIIETRQEKGRGAVATVLVQAGTLRIGDIFVSGHESGRIRSMRDAHGQELKEAGPSTPVEITGMSGLPDAGDDFFVVEDEQSARQVSDNRRAKRLEKEQRSVGGPISLEELSKRANNQAAIELNVIVKADVHGSLEAIRESLEKLSTDKVKVRVLHSGVGGITETDVQLAVASKALVVGFGVRAEQRASAEAEGHGIDIRFYRVIYELIDDIRAAMVGKLKPIREERKLGRVEVRQTFSVPKLGTIAGCYVADGIVKRGAFVRLLRDNRVIHEGKMNSLRRFKDDVGEVQTGFECGIGIDKYNDLKTGDVIEVFEVKEVAATL